MKSAEARLQAMGIFHTTAIRKRALTSDRGAWVQADPRKDQEIYLVIDNLRADLLIAAQGSALEFRDFEAKFVFQDLAGGACRIYLMVCQEIAVILGPFHQIRFLLSLRQGQSSCHVPWQFFCKHTTTLVLSPQWRIDLSTAWQLSEQPRFTLPRGAGRLTVSVSRAHPPPLARPT